MSSNISLKSKIIISVWIILLISILAPWIYFSKIIKNEVNKEALLNIKREFELTKYILLHGKNVNKDNIDEIIKEIGGKIGDRITYILKDGTVIADSKVDKNRLKELDNHATRPEIIMARKTGKGSSIRYSGTIKRKLIYYAEPIYIKEVPSGYLRIARYYSLVDSVLNRINYHIVYVLFLSFLVSGAIISYFIILIIKRIKPIIDLAESLSKGEQAKLIKKSPGKEFDKLILAINNMAVQITNNLRLISNQKKELQGIFDGIDALVVAVDSGGKIMKYNKPFENYFSKNLIGRDIRAIIINRDLIDGLEDALKKGIYVRGIIINLKKRFYSVNIIPISYQKEIMAILVFHDITEQKKLDQIRRDFFANISHELKTPLTSIQGFTETILDTPELDRDKIEFFLRKIAKNCNEIRTLIDGIMEISKIESGEISTSIERINLKEVLDSIWLELMELAKDKNLKFKNIQKPIEIYYDREKLHTIFKNLIHNSIKFSDKNGEISVEVKEYKGYLQIGIKDQGIGISESEQDRVFERFYQTKDAKRLKVAGYGLGLSICKNIVHYFGGDIWVESPILGDEKGCVVWFTIPYDLKK